MSELLMRLSMDGDGFAAVGSHVDSLQVLESTKT